MRWHKSNVEPLPEQADMHLIVKTSDGRYVFVMWDACNKRFYNDTFMGTLSDIDTWCYVEEDDCTMDEMLALSAIQDAVRHVRSLYDILLTDGICCGEEYRDKVGLNELETLYRKLTERILYLDSL